MLPPAPHQITGSDQRVDTLFKCADPGVLLGKIEALTQQVAVRKCRFALTQVAGCNCHSIGTAEVFATAHVGLIR